MQIMSLVTANLTLREFADSDVGWLHPITAEEVVTRYTDWGPNEPQDTHAFLAEATSCGRGRDAFAWAITLGDGTGIGSASLTVTSRHNWRGASDTCSTRRTGDRVTQPRSPERW